MQWPATYTDVYLTPVEIRTRRHNEFKNLPKPTNGQHFSKMTPINYSGFDVGPQHQWTQTSSPRAQHNRKANCGPTPGFHCPNNAHNQQLTDLPVKITRLSFSQRLGLIFHGNTDLGANRLDPDKDDWFHKFHGPSFKRSLNISIKEICVGCAVDRLTPLQKPLSIKLLSAAFFHWKPIPPHHCHI